MTGAMRLAHYSAVHYTPLLKVKTGIRQFSIMDDITLGLFLCSKVWLATKGPV